MQQVKQKERNEDKEKSEKRGGEKQHMVETSLHCGSVILFLATAPTGIHSLSIKDILSPTSVLS